MRKKAVFLLILLLLAGSVVAVFRFWPQKYAIGTSLPETITFWNDREAFLFLNLRTTGRAQNVFQEKLAKTKYGYLTALTGNYIGFSKSEVVAYHLAADGKLDRFSLPDHSVLYGTWGLVDGRIQLTPSPVMVESAPAAKNLGFKWDDANFSPIAAPAQSPITGAANKVKADDEDDDDDVTDSFLNNSTRQQFKSAGWHYKRLLSYGTDASLPIVLAKNDFDLTIENSKPETGKFDFLLYGAKSLKLSGEVLGSAPIELWNQQGWRSVSKSQYEELRKAYGREQFRRPFAWTWLVVLIFLFFWRFGSLFHVAFSFLTMKRRVLKNMATSYSFPAATPAQFPALDVQSLERNTHELEGMGFTRVFDFSLVSDSPASPASFCRLLAHTRHHCFGVIIQFFPRGKAPLPVRCMFEGCLQNGWTIGFSNGNPQATSSLLRRKKALGVSMPGATPSDLLQAFLKMREQVCLDLGISPINDDTLEAFINKTQRAATELREAVQQKNFAKGLPEVYLRKFSLLKTKPEYIWLGDYPKEAERRKQGLSSFASAGR